jgi:hypothetical protein
MVLLPAECRTIVWRILAGRFGWSTVDLQVIKRGGVGTISRVLSAVFLVAAVLSFGGTVGAQSGSADDGNPPAEPSNFSASAASAPDSPDPSPDNSIPSMYVAPSEEQKFRDFEMNAFGPLAFVGSSISAGINQATNFPRAW